MKKRYLTAQEAVNELGISITTLYSYVSRGLIRSEATSESKRTRRYLAEDIDRLQERRELRQHPESVAEKALHWGVPILDSSITLITEQHIYYRGHDVFDLVRTASVEQVIQLIWIGELGNGIAIPVPSEPLMVGALPFEQLKPLLHPLSSLEASLVLLPLAGAHDLSAYDFRPAALAQTGSRILQLLVMGLLQRPWQERSLVSILRQEWQAADVHAEELLSLILILSADNELSTPAFIARCAASTGSSLYAIVQASLSTFLRGTLGGYVEQAGNFLKDIEQETNIRKALVARLKRGEKLMGFGHELFPHGDPRVKVVLDALDRYYGEHPLLVRGREIIREVQENLGEYPKMDFAFVLLERVLQLPEGSAQALFVLGRAIGWIGHAIEQYQNEEMIRPRARYVGLQPEIGDR